MASTYIRARKGRPCPICKADHACAWTADGALVICTHVGRKGETLAAPHGYTIGRPSKGDIEGMLYHLDGAPRPDDEQLEKQRKEQEAYKARGRVQAALVWLGCGPREQRGGLEKLARKINSRGAGWESPESEQDAGGRVASYLASRGLDVAKLPGGVLPRALRYHPTCFERFEKRGEKWARVAGPAMVAAVVDAAGKVTGVHRTFLDPHGPGKRPEELGAAKQMLGACKGRAVRLGEIPAGGGELVVVIAEDLDKSGTGQKYAGVAANAIRALGVKAGVMRITPAVAPTLAETVKGESRPAGGVKGFDWLDVFVKLGPEPLKAALELALAEAGAGPNARVLVFGEGIETCLAVMQATGRPAWACLDAGKMTAVELPQSEIRDPKSEIAPPTPPTVDAGTRADFDASGEGGGASDDGEDGGRAPWIVGGEDEMPIIEEGAVTRARRWLWTCARVRVAGIGGVGGEDAGRFKLARWGGKWWAYHGGAYAELDDEGLRSVALNWLHGFRVQKGRKVLPLDPTPRAAEQMMQALAIDTAVCADRVPAWLPRVIENGRAAWGRASAWGGMLDGQVGRNDPRTLITFPNGVLDLARVIDRKLPLEERVRLLPHSPELFTTTCLPYALPRAELERLVAGTADRDEMYGRLCPKFWAWMHDASNGDEGWPWQLQEMLGDTIGLDRSIEKIFAVPGVQRGGKGVLEEAITHIVGERNVGAMDSLSLSDRFGLAHLVGCSVAIMPDAHIDGHAAGPGVVERLKSISGQGRIPIRDLYSKAQTHKLTCRIWMFMNQEPELKDESAALAGRFIWLPITKGYLGREDHTIKASIPAEAPGIMLLALEGAIRLMGKQRRAIDVCGSAEEIAGEFAEASAPLQTFVGEWLAFVAKDDGGVYLTPDELYQAYECFARQDEKREPLGFRKFIRAVKWIMRPFAYSQPRSDDGPRVRRITGWRIRHERLDQLAEWINQTTQKPRQSGGWWQDR